MNIDHIKLPPGIHATVFTARDVITGGDLHAIIIWADRPYRNCPRCGEPVDQVIDECPVILNAGSGPGGAIEERSQQHRCGEWLGVDWDNLQDPEDLAAFAARLAERLQTDVDDQRNRIKTRLRRELGAALARLAQPLDADETAAERAEEVCTGNELDPGIYLDGDVWLAWAPDPAGGEGDYIAVFANELAESRS